MSDRSTNYYAKGTILPFRSRYGPGKSNKLLSLIVSFFSQHPYFSTLLKFHTCFQPFSKKVHIGSYTDQFSFSHIQIIFLMLQLHEHWTLNEHIFCTFCINAFVYLAFDISPRTDGMHRLSDIWNILNAEWLYFDEKCYSYQLIFARTFYMKASAHLLFSNSPVN